MNDTIDNVDDLVDSGEFAQILGIKRRTVLGYLDRERQAGWPKEGKRGAFPKPVKVFGISPVWTRADAERYALERVGPGWHARGDERVAQYIRQQAAGAAGTDEPADENAAPDQPEVQPT